jgi:hypothetical protein
MAVDEHLLVLKGALTEPGPCKDRVLFLSAAMNAQKIAQNIAGEILGPVAI